MGEVEELCDRIAIVRSGRVVYEGDLDALLHSTGQRYRVRTTDDDVAHGVVLRQRGVSELIAAADGLTFAADEPTVAELSKALVHEGVGITALVPAAASLEELFFRLTEGEEEAGA
jgi:ABC-2 type transport system ATP-binding protein